MRATRSSARAYEQQRYHPLDQRWVNWREQRIVTELLTESRLAGGSLLDIPCGYGRLTALCAGLGIKAIGADVRLDMVGLAAQNVSGSQWVQASIFALPFANGTVDGVLCIRLLHHRYSFAERRQILCELARVARRTIILSFYRFTPVHAVARHWRGTRGRLAMMSMTEFRGLVRTCGLHVQDCRSLLPFLHAQVFVVLSKDAPGTGSTA